MNGAPVDNKYKGSEEKSVSHRSRKERRGAASILAGVLIVGILLSTVFIYFLAIQQGESTRSQSEIESLQTKNEKVLESFRVRSFDSLAAGNKVSMWVNNTGSEPLRVSQVIVYDQGSVPHFTALSGAVTINGGISKTVTSDYSLPDTTKKYRIDVVTERGNIVSTTWPPPVQNINTQQISTIAEFATQTLIAQGLGSIQLDFDSFGQILPTNQTGNSGPYWLISREGVDQTGWKVRASDSPGYPAFRVQKDLNTYLVLRVRNMDASGQNITLFHDTGLVLSLTKDQNQNQNVPIYLCNATEASSSVNVSGYDETVANRTIILRNAADPSVGKTERWVDLFFCDKNVNRGTGANFDTTWKAVIPANTVPINPTFLIARGEFTESHRQYGQTIPYQAVTITDGYSDQFLACLKSVNQPTVDTGNTKHSCKTTDYDDYKAPKSSVDGTLSGGIPYRVYLKLTCIYMDCGASGTLNRFTVDWIYPDGEYRTLKENATASTATNNIALDLPLTMADNSTPIQTGYYIMQVTDFNDQAYYITFQVTSG